MSDIIFIRSGLNLTGCQKIHLLIIGRQMTDAGICFAQAMQSLHRITAKVTYSVKSLEKAALAINPLIIQAHKISKEKKPKYIRQQHKLAVKFSNRK
ncbi:hypothetical protein ACR79B_11100 [Sphingobacterium spiritivorum]|uniref:hypothetical protein n=1 Tax=Sphingobacterium spiritivorum TaxID=258 RepID=UPI003DA401D6